MSRYVRGGERWKHGDKDKNRDNRWIESKIGEGDEMLCGVV